MISKKKNSKNDELVEYTAPLLGTKDRKDVIVGVNGETIRIKRGVKVKIPRKYVKVLEQATAQEYAAYQVMENAKKRSSIPVSRL